MGAIFISYRREDSEGHAGRLFEDLVARFGKNSVFMDVTGIEPGRDFRKVIDSNVGTCGVLLAVIGKAWLTVKDESGARRIDDPIDFVRMETISALKRDIPVVPVLVHGAVMPRVDQLPPELSEFAFRNGVELTHARWESDIQVLLRALQPYVQDQQPDTGPAAIESNHATAATGSGIQGAATQPLPAKAKSPKIIAILIGAVVIVLGGTCSEHYAQKEKEAQLIAQRKEAEKEAKKRADEQAKRDAERAALQLAADDAKQRAADAKQREMKLQTQLDQVAADQEKKKEEIRRLAEQSARKAPTRSSGSGIGDAKGCRVEGNIVNARQTFTWSGACPNGLADGPGLLEIFESGKKIVSAKGNMRGGKPYGVVTLSFANGATYVGGLENGNMAGHGILRLPDGNRLEGEFKAGKLNGKGAVIGTNGARSTGFFVNGLPNGRFVIIAPNGQRSEKTFANGKEVSGR
jgi:hypothetical protein